jgi:hypothetical protein
MAFGSAAGLGDEIALFGGPPRDPLAARFTVLIAM